ncbi:HK97-gp10 family putative phage morphogenesis protein [Paucilactobacillus sp. N302-9]
MSTKGIKVTGVKELRKKLVTNAKMTEVKRIVRDNTADMESHTTDLEARVYTKGYSKGDTRKQTHMAIQKGGMLGIVGMGMSYDAYLEYGTRYMQPEQALTPAFLYQKKKFIEDLNKLTD